MDLATGTMVTPNVRLVQLLAQGGMGSVWLADHLGLDARVAVKFISPDLVRKEPSLRERFKREASIGARLRSVHVVQTFDHGAMEDGTQYIVMELLEGNTLTEVCSARGRMSPREVGVILAQVCKVLNRAHELGIVHRDIKPDNLFINESDYELFVKVLDFGIAKHTQTQPQAEVVTKTGAIVGSPEFMSPEQAINSKEVDHRTDLFSLAVVAYYALTLELPFEDKEDKPFWISLTSGEHMAVTARVPSLPAGLDGFFKKALAAKPKDRFVSAKEMADAWGRVVANDLSGSYPPNVGPPPAPKPGKGDDTPVVTVRSSPSEDFSEQQTRRWIRPEFLPGTEGEGPATRPMGPSRTLPADWEGPPLSTPPPALAKPWTVPPPPGARALPWIIAATVLVVLGVLGAIFILVALTP